MAKTKSVYLVDLKAAIKECEAIRRDTEHPVDITLAEYVHGRWGVSMEAFYDDLQVDPTRDTIQNLVNMPDENYRWLIPEIYRDAIRLGMRKSPMYPKLIRSEESVAQTSIKMPAINMSDATPMMLGVAETIPIGEVSFDQKDVKIYKMGRGIKVPYEILNYVNLNLVSIFMEDYGVKLGMGMDYLAIRTLLNGDQADGSDAVATIGIATANTLIYKDMLKAWVRMSRIGRAVGTTVAGEDMGIDYLELLTNTRLTDTQRTGVTIDTPIPSTSNIYIHAGVTANKMLLVDPTSALLKLNAQPLLVETDKIISNQTVETYATLTTGFATIFRDARLVIDRSLAFSGAGFPAWMNPDVEQLVTFS